MCERIVCQSLNKTFPSFLHISSSVSRLRHRDFSLVLGLVPP